MDEATAGLAASYWNAVWDPDAPWPQVCEPGDRRLSPERGGGRRMRHPFLAPIVYPRNPDQTFNFGYDRLRRIPAVTVKTLSSSGTAKYPEAGEDVVIREVWLADDLSTLTRFFHSLHAYHREALPAGRYIGWQPRDLSPRSYFVDLLNVEVGEPDAFLVEELGAERPFLMRKQLTVSFRLLRELQHPTGTLTLVGY